MFKYRIYGINVLSNLEMDCFTYDFDNADLEIRFTNSKAEARQMLDKFCMGEIPAVVRSASGSWCVYMCGLHYIVAYYEVDPRVYLTSFILGYALSYILFKQRIFLLHGSCVVYKDSATVFLGSSGAGKSTLAAGFSDYGGKMLSDDMTRIAVDTEIPYVFPSYPIQRLTRKTMEHLDLDISNATRIAGEDEKYALNDSGRHLFLDEPQPVRAIVCIAQCESSTIQLIREDIRNSILLITNNIINNGLLRSTRVEHDYFSFVLAVCEKIPVYTLYRPQNAFTINEQVTTILRYIYNEG